MPKRISAPVAFAVVLCVGAVFAQTRSTPAVPSDDLEVIATLLDAPPVTPDCGTMHIAVAMRYSVVRVVHGVFPSGVLYAIHGCPGMTRRQYGGAAGGTLTAFHVGDRHHLVLRRRWPTGTGGPSLWPEPNLAGVAPNTVYWTVRADPAP